MTGTTDQPERIDRLQRAILNGLEDGATRTLYEICEKVDTWTSGIDYAAIELHEQGAIKINIKGTNSHQDRFYRWDHTITDKGRQIVAEQRKHHPQGWID